MNIPHWILAKLADKDTIWQSMQMNVVIIWGRNNEFVLSKLFPFNNLNAIDDGLVSYNKPLYFDVVCGMILSELEVLKVPKLKTSRCVTSD